MCRLALLSCLQFSMFSVAHVQAHSVYNTVVPFLLPLQLALCTSLDVLAPSDFLSSHSLLCPPHHNLSHPFPSLTSNPHLSPPPLPSLYLTSNPLPSLYLTTTPPHPLITPHPPSPPTHTSLATPPLTHSSPLTLPLLQPTPLSPPLHSPTHHPFPTLPHLPPPQRKKLSVASSPSRPSSAMGTSSTEDLSATMDGRQLERKLHDYRRRNKELLTLAKQLDGRLKALQIENESLVSVWGVR